MQTNPLKEETDEQMIKAVKDYYTEKKADTEFVEMYDHFKIRKVQRYICGVRQI